MIYRFLGKAFAFFLLFRFGKIVEKAMYDVIYDELKPRRKNGKHDEWS